MNNKKIGLALRGGGALSIEALRPYDPDLVIAVSIDLFKKKDMKPYLA